MDKKITQLLNSRNNNNNEDEEKLYQLTYFELKKLARSQLNRFSSKRSLDTTELVHEAYLKLKDKSEWSDRNHFYSVACLAMRQILLNTVKKNQTQKRIINPVEYLEYLDNIKNSQLEDNILSLNNALLQLEKHNERACRVIELRIFVGMNIDECADVLETSRATVKRDWAFAKAWLYQFLTESSQN